MVNFLLITINNSENKLNNIKKITDILLDTPKLYLINSKGGIN